MSRVASLLRAAEASKDRGLARVLTGLAIPGCGSVMSHRLAERFQSADRLLCFAEAYVVLREKGYRFRKAWELAEAFCWHKWPEDAR